MSTTTVHTADLRFQGCERVIALYIVPHAGGVVLLDPGPHICFAALTAALQHHGYAVADVTDVLLTHIHFDHAGAAWALARAGARVHVHPAGERHLADPSRLWDSAARIYGREMMLQLWGDMQAIEPDRLRTWQHEERDTLGSLGVRALHTPGHAKHHIAWRLGDAMFLGDVGGVRIASNLVEPPCPPPDIDVEAWQRSIGLVRDATTPNTKAYLAHYGEVVDLTSHLGALESELLAWATEARALVESGVGGADGQFADFIERRRRRSLPEADLGAYALANPAHMSYAGLKRYFERRATS